MVEDSEKQCADRGCIFHYEQGTPVSVRVTDLEEAVRAERAWRETSPRGEGSENHLSPLLKHFDLPSTNHDLKVYLKVFGYDLKVHTQVRLKYVVKMKTYI